MRRLQPRDSGTSQTIITSEAEINLCQNLREGELRRVYSGGFTIEIRGQELHLTQVCRLDAPQLLWLHNSAAELHLFNTCSCTDCCCCTVLKPSTNQTELSFAILYFWFKTRIYVLHPLTGSYASSWSYK